MAQRWIVGSGRQKNTTQAMDPKHFIRAAIALSVIGHLALAFGVIFADARPFDTPPPQAIAIDIVRSDDIKPPEKEPVAPESKKAEDPFRLPELSPLDNKAQSGQQSAAQKPAPQQSAQQQPAKQQAANAPSQEAAQPPPSQPAAAQPQQAPQQPPPAAQQQASLQQQAPPQQQASPQPAQPPSAQVSPPAAEPDVTVKYGVMLGLPTGDGGSAAFAKADIAPLDIAAFRQHLRTCSSMPQSVSASDKVRIVMRALFSPDGKLMAPPALIEASASAKGPLLMQAAIKALQDCQPYTMLPADKYNEWRMLDLAFTPPDFAG
jgi:hypothetical protein